LPLINGSCYCCPPCLTGLTNFFRQVCNNCRFTNNRFPDARVPKRYWHSSPGHDSASWSLRISTSVHGAQAPQSSGHSNWSSQGAGRIQRATRRLTQANPVQASPRTRVSFPCSRSSGAWEWCALAAVATVLCTSVVLLSMTMGGFLTKYHRLPIFVLCMSGSRA